jgi:hypothetical protein
MKMILALAFVKIDEIYNINLLYDELPEEMFPFLEWFKENYIGTVIKNHRQSLRYFPITWNVHERVLKKENRTNYHAEAANRQLIFKMAVDHPKL